MQDSFLQNEQEEQTNHVPQKKNQLPYSEQKTYNIELPFMEKFKQQLQNIQMGIQSILISLTNCQQSEKKRIPYHVIKNFQKNLKELRTLKQFISQQNGYYIQEVNNRQKQKLYKNMEFKRFLKQYGKKRQELKAYIAKLEARVRKLEDSGYAQYVQYDVCVPEINTIRFSFSNKTLLFLTDTKAALLNKIQSQMIRRKGLLIKLKEAYLSKKRKQIEQIDSQQKEQGQSQHQISQQKTIGKIPLLNYQTSISLTEVIQVYKIYSYYKADCIVFPNSLKLKQSNLKLQLQISQLKSALKQTQQLIYKQKLSNGVRSNDPSFTKTDNLILLKQYKLEIQEKVQGRLFLRNQRRKLGRSSSWSNHQQKQRQLIHK